LGVVEHRVATIVQRSCAGVVGFAREVQSPPAVRPDRAAHADGGLERAPLFDVQFDEDADALEELRVRADQGRVQALGRHGLGPAHAVAVAQVAGPGRVDRAGHQPRPEARDAEPRALLLGEDPNAQGAAGRHTALAQQVDRRQRRHDAQRPVEGAAVRHRVQVAAGGDRAGRRSRAVPPGPQVAVPVTAGPKAPFQRMIFKPVTAGRVRFGPGEPPVPAGRLVAA
jgi:hypothetical protein